MPARQELSIVLYDVSPHVRIAAAETLACYGTAVRSHTSVVRLGKNAPTEVRTTIFTAVAALNAIDAVGEKAAPLKPVIHRLPTTAKSSDPRYDTNVPQLLIA